MRYRHLGYRYAMVVTTGQPRPYGEGWRGEQVSIILAQPRWRPAADVYETATALEVTVELAGVDQDVLLFEDALVVEGRRRLAPADRGGVYHAAEIRQGPFRVDVSLPAPIEAKRVEARYEQGLLHILLPKMNRR
jgi:HSP20 family protein